MGDDARVLLDGDAPFRLFFEHSPDAILLIDPHHPSGSWTIVDCNPVTCRMHGYTREELVGRSLDLLNVLPELASEADYIAYLELLRRSGSFQGQSMHRRKDGSEFPVEYSTALLTLNGHELILGIDRDVTERKRLEQLQAEETQFRLLFEHSPDAILLIDPHHLSGTWPIISCNTVACRMYGFPAEELAGRSVVVLNWAEGIPAMALATMRKVREAGTVRDESVHRRHDGSAISVERSLVLVTHGGRDLILTTLRDVTDRRRAERRLATQHAVSRILAQASLFEEAAPQLLQIIGENLEWDLGILWRIDDAANLLRSSASWHAATGSPPGLAVDLVLPKGVGLAGDVWLRAEPAWIDDLRMSTRIPGELASIQATVRSVFAFPMFAHTHVFGVVEFFSRTPRAPDADLIDTMTAIGRQMGQFLERRRVERALRFQAHLLDTVEQAVVATHLDGTITYWNRSAQTLYGWAAAEVIGRNIVDVTPAQTTRSQAEEIMDRLRAGESWAGEFVVQRQDGTTFSALITDNPIYDEAGDLIGVVGVSVDITARKRAEEASHFLAAASAVLTASLDDTQILWDLARLAVPQIADWCAVDMVDGDRTFRRVAVTHTDPAKVEIAWEIERRYGFDPDLPHGAAKVLRTGHAELYPEITEALLAQVAHDEEHLRLLNLVGLRSGMIVPLVARGRTLGALSFGIAESQRRLDVDDLHLAEDLANRAALAVDNARLYQDSQVAVQLRDEFLSVAAHELKTPVTAIVGYSQVLRRRVDQALNPRDRRALQVLAEQAERLSRLVNSLLDASRIQIGQFNLERRPVDLGQLARRIAGEMARTLPGHSLEYRQPSEPVIIDGDALRLEQVLLNLLQNAVKYSPKGGPITLSVERRDSEAVLFVSDQGIGIPAAAMPLLFQRFFRAGNAAGSTLSGMGVGLYVVQEIVSRHGGRVGVESTEGKGTTVTVYLPLRESQPQTT